MKKQIYFYLKLFLFLGTEISRSYANTECELDLVNLPAKIQQIAAVRPEVGRVYEFFSNLQDQRLSALFPQERVYRILALEENSFYSKRLDQFIQLYAASTQTDVFTRVRESLTKVLTLRVPDQQIAQRIDALMNSNPSDPELSGKIARALGAITFDEMKVLVYGGVDHRNPTADSLLGKYIAETGAAKVVRKFSKVPYDQAPGMLDRITGQANSKLGEDRLVVAVSEATLPIYKKYFETENFLLHVHTPSQGTLNIAHNNRVATYGGGKGEFRTPTLGSILPHILLSTTEAQRMTQFMDLLTHSDSNLRSIAQQPWRLEGYCAVGGYTSCTHWFGNIPIGDQLKTAYLMPGYVDHHASNSIYDDPVMNASPRIQLLGKIMAFNGMNFEQTKQFLDSNPLIERVWKNPGNEQLASVLGALEQNGKGEFASPGYVALTLTAVAKVDRVPVVFYVVQDARAAISATFDPQINAI